MARSAPRAFEALRTKVRDRLVAGVVEVATAPLRRVEFRRSFGPVPEGAASLRIVSGDGTALHADVYTPDVAPEGTVILAHGYRRGRRQLAFLALPLLAARQRVIAFDFRGHGQSGGERVTIGAREAEDVRAVLAAARELQEKNGERGRLAFLGFSMGASAYLLAGVEADIAVIDSPYDTLEGAVAARVRRLGLPETLTEALTVEGSRRTGIEFAHARPIDRAAQLTRPSLFIFARQDPWIDPATRDAFARVLPPSADFLLVPGGHRLHFGPAWRAAVLEFLLRS